VKDGSDNPFAKDTYAGKSSHNTGGKKPKGKKMSRKDFLKMVRDKKFAQNVKKKKKRQ